MRGIKNFLVASALILCGIINIAVFTVTQSPAYAEDACSIAGETDPLLCGTPKSDEEKELMARVKAILDTVYLWIGIIAVIVIVIGGVKYMTSTGDSQKIQNAKNTIMYAVIGLVVTLAAFAITNFVIGALQGKEAGGGGGGTAETTPSDPSDPSSPDRQKVRAVSVASKVNVVAGQEATLKVKIIPDYATNQKVTFTSADPTIATVDSNGKISAKKAGETTITVASPEGPSKEVKVTVQQPVAVKSITISPAKVEVKKGKTTTVKATIVPSNAADKTIAWESADPKIATVTQAGKIKGIKEGTTTVTVTARNKLTFAAAPTSNIILADSASIADITSSPTAVKAKFTVTVPSETWEVADTPTTERKYTGSKSNPKFTSQTQKIVNEHKNDFNCKTFSSFMKKHGGYTAYVKSLGGIFAQLAGKKPTVKTAADFQAAAEYVYGLWTIWGPDYNNWYTTPCSDCKYVNWSGSDAFYSACPNLRGNGVGYSVGYAPGKSIDTVLKASKKVRTHCNGSVNVFMKSLGNKYLGSSADPKKMLRNGGKKITGVNNLQVGDVLAFFKDGGWRHTAIVGEVYKDYIVTYDGGSTSMRKHNFKRAYKKTKFYSGYTWYAVRIYNIDQTKTLKGL